jgi:hypothetical protein
MYYCGLSAIRVGCVLVVGTNVWKESASYLDERKSEPGTHLYHLRRPRKIPYKVSSNM